MVHGCSRTLNINYLSNDIDKKLYLMLSLKYTFFNSTMFINFCHHSISFNNSVLSWSVMSDARAVMVI